MTAPAFETIIGLEVHVQLLTNSKLFCRCPAKFGQAANTMTCPVCTGMPGSLPVLNKRAIELAIKTGIALNCEIPKFTKWDRKNYFYPDLPKGYQVSQFDLPITQNGNLQIESSKGLFENKKIGITRAHLEEDAGKSMHDEQHGTGESRIDLNRTGTPLLEIVSQPDMRSPAEARAFLTELKLLLTYLNVSDCNMQEGSLRVDANVNLHIRENEATFATPIVEIKNLNSFRAVERALEFEEKRQRQAWFETRESKEDSPKQTRLWDDAKEETRIMRAKEESSDYRYFPDPDLVSYHISPEEIEAARQSVGELPAAIRKRIQNEYKLSAYDSDVLVKQGRGIVEYFETVARGCGDGKLASNWITQDVLRTLNEQNLEIEQFSINADRLTTLLKTIQSGELDKTRAKDVFAGMLESNNDAKSVMKELGIVVVSDIEIRELCQSLLDKNPHTVADYKGGKKQAIGALIGQAKKVNRNVNPDAVRKTLIELLDE